MTPAEIRAHARYHAACCAYYAFQRRTRHERLEAEAQAAMQALAPMPHIACANTPAPAAVHVPQPAPLVRDRIVQFLHEHGPATYHGISNGLGLGPDNTKDYCGQLKRDGRIMVLCGGRGGVPSLYGVSAEQAQAAGRMMRQAGPRADSVQGRAIAYLRQHGGTGYATDIAHETGMDYTQVLNGLSKLADAGLVTRPTSSRPIRGQPVLYALAQEQAT